MGNVIPFPKPYKRKAPGWIAEARDKNGELVARTILPSSRADRTEADQDSAEALSKFMAEHGKGCSIRIMPERIADRYGGPGDAG